MLSEDDKQGIGCFFVGSCATILVVSVLLAWWIESEIGERLDRIEQKLEIVEEGT